MESARGRAFVCGCMLFTVGSGYLLPPHLSGHLLTQLGKSVSPRHDNVIMQSHTGAETGTFNDSTRRLFAGQ